MANPPNVRPRYHPANWSSLGSLNSFADSKPNSSLVREHPNENRPGAVNGPTPGRETLHSRFEFKQTLGKGTYGKVKLALDKRKNEQVAIKTIKKSRIENPHDLARIRREIDFMTSLNHPYIIKIKEVYESREKIILVMDYASGGELYDYLNRMKRISEAEARTIFRQIVSAVHFLHKNHIVHRDLKLENILIDQKGDIKLADFGLSNSWSPRRLLHTFCGSPLYASPEIVSGIPYYGPEVDCWSLGVLLYTLVYGSMPFHGGDYNRLVRNITSGEFIQPREQSGAYSLIQYCLKPDANARATTKDILSHPWLVRPSIQRDYCASNPISTELVTESVSPSTSVAELELHTSSFFDSTRFHEPSSHLKVNQPSRQRVSAIPISTRYLSSANSISSRSSPRRPFSLTLDQSIYASSDRYALKHPGNTSSETSTPSCSVPQDSKRPSTNPVQIDSPLPLTTNPIAPSVFTTSAIKFAPAPVRRQTLSIDSESSQVSSNSSRLISNPLPNITEGASLYTNDFPSLTSLELPPTNLSKPYLLDDNNNFISLRIYD